LVSCGKSWLSGSNVQIKPNPEAQEHEEKYLESGYRNQLHHLPVLFKSPDG
jgi:hypothetical protein